MAKRTFNRQDYIKRLSDEKENLNLIWKKIIEDVKSESYVFESQYVATVMKKILDLDKRIINENLRNLV